MHDQLSSHPSSYRLALAVKAAAVLSESDRNKLTEALAELVESALRTAFPQTSTLATL
jgi:hypothetical protein